jgi:hypothetical protein
MAHALGMSQTAVSRIWRAFGLKPHLRETFKFSTDPYFVEKVRDVVGLYLSPPDRAIVLSVDEKSQVQGLHDHLHLGVPPKVLDVGPRRGEAVCVRSHVEHRRLLGQEDLPVLPLLADPERVPLLP